MGSAFEKITGAGTTSFVDRLGRNREERGLSQQKEDKSTRKRERTSFHEGRFTLYQKQETHFLHERKWRENITCSLSKADDFSLISGSNSKVPSNSMIGAVNPFLPDVDVVALHDSVGEVGREPRDDDRGG